MSASKSIRYTALFGAFGAIFGVVLAVFLMALTFMHPGPLTEFILRLTFRLCPLFVVGIGLKSWLGLITVVLVSNAFIYGVPFAAIGGVIATFWKGSNDNRVSST
ncbi:MAG: hypothetical protein WB341_01960 [Terracidiphilus sp.]